MILAFIAVVSVTTCCAGVGMVLALWQTFRKET
jgi:hypothetical protein